MSKNEFFTFTEYMKKDENLLSPSGEDYMEMIYRLSMKTGFTRVNNLASALNVQPPSVTKMLHKLANLKLIKYEKYGVIMLEKAGTELGKSLLNRHNIIEQFLKLLSINDGVLEETEKIEHTINAEILCGMNDLVDFFAAYPDFFKKFNEFRKPKSYP
ncbi:Mn-dependent DtxR family transcriptional regulator [Clostridium acetobutylicum]|uniref:Manganese transport regulator n=1 Tax=Clostridium acetobutylicum (strain ATCC 824 / DSM 792 / JCM 1419 / IAM 19013 / LMG 5710 / NBRC 13948 / NRRL B-527 / VKM B-1787 / 2291 / W) TaxID=272562 RepID=Q97FW0_CLOAB|nr:MULTISPECIES: iron dependent repressor, metal binding and dimerization domain protein [Clostridium]AAK80563.1 Predicted iron-dependent transcription repressor [Clostridium acetobutylicum ATCC 824]ADZ21662.1 iron-dependent transcription repressor [Clostridium acetobutylicum EA 2018]AEI32468.1 iron-dependent transcription repressor [Clostridium acetobutylicum DSM 1731]AWV79020.1 Fur family transcriptional regulator [Clostridium acetobutylicum]KHD38716.1 Fur family transcriptional regulator [C